MKLNLLSQTIIKKIVFLLLLIGGIQIQGYSQATLPVTRTIWTGVEPTGWSNFGTSDRTSIFACTGSNAATFDNNNDSAIVNFTGIPLNLTFSLKEAGMASGSKIVVSQSNNGINYTLLGEYGPAPATVIPLNCSPIVISLAGTTRYIKWAYVKIIGNCDIDDVNISAGSSLTNPAPQALPYLQNFGTTAFTTYPTGFQGFNGVDGSIVNSQTLAEASAPTTNAAITSQAVAFAAEPSGGLYGFATNSNGRLAIATSNSTTEGLNQPTTAITTPAATTVITVSYDYEVLFSGNRTMGLVLQYRAGFSGAWISVSGSTVNYAALPTLNSLRGFAHTITGLTAATVYQFRWASWRVHAPGTTNTTIGLDNIAITANQPTITDLIVPRFIQGLNGTNVERTPYAYRVRLDNLAPSRAYRYYNQVVLSSDLATTNGSGNPIFTNVAGFVLSTNPSLATVNNFGTFTTNAAGSIELWLANEPTGDARFTPGNSLQMRLMLNNSNSSSETENYRLTTSAINSVRVINYSTLAGVNNGSGIRGVSSAFARNFVLLYDEELGTSRPLTATFAEIDGTTNTTNYVGFYGSTVNGVAGAWGAIIPNNNANGVRRIEQRANNSGLVVGCARDDDGKWISGTETRNPTDGNIPLIIDIADAPLTSCIVSVATDVVGVASSEIALISSLINTATITTNTDGVQVWQFTIREGGVALNDADAFNTIITRLRITKNTGDQVNDWSDAIQSVGLFDGTTLLGNGTVFNDSIVFVFSSNLVINDGTAKTLSLRLSLQTAFNNVNAGNLDGDDFVFQILNTNLFINPLGSGVAAFTNVISTNGQNVISVVATKLIFLQQPTNTGVGSSISPSVRVQATDINNNVDLQFVSTVSITSTGTLTGTPVNVAAISGVATFSSLTHTVAQNGIILTASTATITPSIISNLFDIVPITQFQPGDLTIVAFNTDISNGDDEITIVTFRDILIGTRIDFTDNAFEKCNPGSKGWGLSEGWFRIERTTSTLLAGNTITIRITAAGVASVVSPDANWISSRPQVALGQGTFNMNNSGEQIFILQGGVIGGSGNSFASDAGTYTGGGIVSGFNTKGDIWTPICANSAGGGTQNSGKPIGIDCFLIYPTAAADKNKFVGDGTATYLTTARTKRQWLDAIGTPSFWRNYVDNTSYNANTALAPDYVNFNGTGLGRNITITPGGFADGMWTGTKNNLWSACENWESFEQPFIITDVTIPNVPNAPLLDAAVKGSVRNITLQPGSSLTVSTTDSLIISGSFTNNGTFTQTAGKVVFTTTEAAAITGPANSTTTFFDLTVDKGTGGLLQFDRNIIILPTGLSAITLRSGTFNLSGTNTLTLGKNITVTTGRLATNPLGSIIINGAGPRTLSLDQTSVSSRSLKNLTVNNAFPSLNLSIGAPLELHGTLTLAAVTGTLTTNNNLTLMSNDTTTARIAQLPDPTKFTGNVTVQRYNGGIKRRYRHLSSPVTTISGIAPTQIIDNTWVTGPGGTLNGFDASTRNSPSIFTYSEPLLDNMSTTASRQIGFVGVSSINTNLLTGTGFLLFTRGPRSQANAFDPNSTPLPVTLDFTGLINKGNVPVGVTFTPHVNVNGNEFYQNIDGFNFLGNPYPSPIDAGLFVLSNAVMDPFVYSYNIISEQYDIHNINTPAASNPANAPRNVALGQGFFVKANGTLPSLNFTESMKVGSVVSNVYTRNASSLSAIDIFRLKISKDSNNEDETVLIFEANNSKNYQLNKDALKFFGSGVSLSSISKDHLFTAIKYLPEVLVSDTVSLFVNQIPEATISLSSSMIQSFNPLLDVFLLDNYLNTSTDLRTNNSYLFQTNTNIASFGSDRFKLVFSTQVPLSSTLLNLNGKAEKEFNRLTWTAKEDGNSGSYSIQKSTDGKSFEEIGVQDFGKLNANANYSFVDNNIQLGVSYYRLQLLDGSKKSNFSKTISINRSETKESNLTIYPNPSTSNITVSIPKNYETDSKISIIDASGKSIKSFTLKAGQREMNTDVSRIASGNYVLLIQNSSGSESISFTKK